MFTSLRKNQPLTYLRHAALLLSSLALAFSAGAIGALATIPNIPTWYESLTKPPLLPPNDVFGIVWSVLYFLMGVALYVVLISKTKHDKTNSYTAFGAQLCLNTLWTIVFFGFHMPWVGVIIIVGLIAAIVWNMQQFAQFSRTAAWLLAPYLAWVGFATYLTIGVAILN